MQNILISVWQLINIPFLRLIRFFMVDSVDTRLYEQPLGKKIVIASNHVFWTDPFMVCYSFPLRELFSYVPFSFFIANRFINNPILRPFARLFGGFPAKKHRRLGWGMSEARKRLLSGPVMIFPEGRFTRYKGQHQPKWGVSALAGDENVVIIPVHIRKNSNKFLRRFSITIGAPQDMSGKSPQEIMDVIYNL